MTPAAVPYPPPYASGGPAGGQTIAFDPREQGDGLRPKPLLHSGSVGSFQGNQGFASPRSSPVRCSPVPGCAPRAASGRALDTLSTSTAKHAIRKRTSSPQGRFRGLAYQARPKAEKTRCRPVSAPLNERMTGQGRNAATAGWCGPQPGTGEDSGQTGRTLDAAAAARASRRGSRGGLLTPAPAGRGASSPEASLTRVASARPGARCHRPARRYVTKTACVSYLYHVSYLYWYKIHDTRYRRPRYDPV
jgi:hypothetical protein